MWPALFWDCGRALGDWVAGGFVSGHGDRALDVEYFWGVGCGTCIGC